ncbi:MAG: hypothetical protein KBS81_02750 [Spirochaetales bacterium]|nr:hypothetical protein [Candidatus Physcosoma equi]
MKTERKAYAKVNIGLKVGEKRPDGYHNLDSHFLRIPVYDTLYINIEEGPFSVTVEGNESYMAPGKKDLMEKAADYYHERSGIDFALTICVEKHIPTQAGLGGGSSDAAEVFLALNEEFHAFSKEELVALSSHVGADVPFFVSEYKAARVHGIGEILEEEEPLFPYRWISLFREVGSGVSTKEAYEKQDAETRDGKSLPSLSGILRREDYPNDFELIEGDALLPLIQNYAKTGDNISLSGSGSVWFLLSMEECRATQEEFLLSVPLFE